MQTRWQTWSHPVQAIVDALRGNGLLQIGQFRGVGRHRGRSALWSLSLHLLAVARPLMLGRRYFSKEIVMNVSTSYLIIALLL